MVHQIKSICNWQFELETIVEEISEEFDEDENEDVEYYVYVGDHNNKNNHINTCYYQYNLT